MKLFAAGLTLIAASLFLAVGTGSAARTHASATAVTVVMRDPGCHWFSVNGAFKRTLTVKGPAAVANFDMSALEVIGGPTLRKIAVGGKVTLVRGTYRIVMVGQASDDNVLKLLVR